MQGAGEDLLQRAVLLRAVLQNVEVFSKTPGFWIENIGKSPKTPSFVEDARLFEGWGMEHGAGGWGLEAGGLVCRFDRGEFFVRGGSRLAVVVCNLRLHRGPSFHGTKLLSFDRWRWRKVRT